MVIQVGEERFSTGTTPTTYRYTGQRRDSYINLYWYGSRWYDHCFNFPLDGCYARAHLMAQRIQARYDVTIEKVWAKRTADAPLEVKTNGVYGTVKWGWHVAPMITVTDANGNPSQWVIDPSIADRPVTIDEWAQMMNASVDQTKTSALGDPAPGITVGSGYIPSYDPYFGPYTTEAMLDAHAANWMEKYLACGNVGSRCGIP